MNINSLMKKCQSLKSNSKFDQTLLNDNVSQSNLETIEKTYSPDMQIDRSVNKPSLDHDFSDTSSEESYIVKKSDRGGTILEFMVNINKQSKPDGGFK